MRTHRLLVTTTALTLALVGTACGSEEGTDQGGAGASEAERGSEEALRQAVEDNLAAMNAGDTDAFLAGQSARCRELTTASAADQAMELIGTLYGDISLRELDILEFDGTSARVLGTTGIEALDDAGEQDGARWVWEEGAWRSDDCEEGATGQAADEDPAEGDTSATVPSDLAVGESHAWDDGVSVTVAALAEIPLDSLGEFDTVTEGHTPFWVELEIVNDGDQPLDLSEFGLIVEGATNGGAVESVYLEDTEFLEGRLAPGETMDFRDAHSIDTARNGSELVIEVWRYNDDMGFEPPTWVGSLS
ncbi:DUF4352 domain-containing protein [Streptomyces marincola]|uniref:DUF4352 domain-containing protein n=1 Tax=Streptomyces marincola TaxID=2878388 RepID=UPI001CF4D642|nr:DUF4352 domain-containing protein [Streptomyces marincola]UCM88588.1 DUF4352 domain-containing protein [Streptomyces marincola]